MSLRKLALVAGAVASVVGFFGVETALADTIDINGGQTTITEVPTGADVCGTVKQKFGSCVYGRFDSGSKTHFVTTEGGGQPPVQSATMQTSAGSGGLPSGWTSQPTEANTNLVLVNGQPYAYCPPNAGDVRQMVGGKTYQGRAATDQEKSQGVWWVHQITK